MTLEDRDAPAREYDVTVVGGGPAGLSAAAAAASTGCRVLIVDAAAQLGGQYYRHLPGAMHATDPGRLHHDFAAGAELLHKVSASENIDVLSSTSVFAAVPAADDTVDLHLTGTAQGTSSVRTGNLILATGAFDRSLPFPGWELPGVFTPGGAQALLKGQYVLPGRRVVVAGTGPFLLPVAAGLAEAGAQVLGVHDAAAPYEWVRRLDAVTGSLGKLGEGAHYARVLARHRVPVRFRSAVTKAHGAEAVESVTLSKLDASWRIRPGRDRQVACDAVCVGWGFTPNLELAVALGLATRTDRDGTVAVSADTHGRTSRTGVFVAGELAGVAGSGAAVAEGGLAGLAAATRAGRLDEDALRRLGRPLVRRRGRERRFGAALLDVYPVRDGWTSWATDTTLLCRCEEVTVGQVRAAAADMGASDMRSLKLMTRVGMGPCQGRVCGSAAATVLQSCTGRPVDRAPFAKRPIAVPVTLGELARHDG